jgi:2,4-dienoyl-CoA reductase (NADPH2)
VDAIHVSSGRGVSAPEKSGRRPSHRRIEKDLTTALISSGALALRNYLFFTGKLTADLFKQRWESARGPKDKIEGLNRADAHTIKQAVGDIPVICTGGFQTAAIIEDAITRGDCDAVSIARPLIANNDLVPAVRPRNRPACTPVYLLQQVSGQRARESARLL